MFGVISVQIPHILTQPPPPRITLQVHRILVVHIAIEAKFLRNASMTQ